jgi:hypothetical protein
MTKFEDQLFTDLMHQYRPVLERAGTPAAAGRHSLRRPAWLAGGAVGVAGAVAAGVTVLGTASPAFAVTQNPNGTTTIAVSKPSGVAGANIKLHAIGLRAVLVPVRSGCPSLSSLPAAPWPRGHRYQSSTMGRMSRGGEGSITIDAHGIPRTDTAVVAVRTSHHGRTTQTTMAVKLTRGPVPSCVSLPPVQQWHGQGHGQAPQR